MANGRSFKVVAYKLLDGPTIVTPTFTPFVGRLLTCGFEEQNFLQTMWTDTPVTGGGTITIDTSIARTGVASAKVVAPLAGTAQFGRVLAVTLASPFSLRARTYIRFDTANAFPTSSFPAEIMNFNANLTTGSACGARVSNEPRFRLYNRSGSAFTAGTVTVQTATWYRLEMTAIVTSVGGGNSLASYTLAVYLGDASTPLETLTLSETLSSGLLNTAYVVFGPRTAAGTVQQRAWYDDIIIQTTGAIGASGIYLVQPGADVTVAWGRTGAGTNALAVGDEPGLPNDDTKYVSTTSTSAEDQLRGALIPTLPGPTAIRMMDIYGRQRSTSATPTMAYKAYDPAGTAFVGPTITLNTVYAMAPTSGHHCLTLNNFKRFHFDQTRIGYAALSGAQEKRVTALWANVEV